MTRSFGPFTLNPDSGTLLRGGKPVPLSHRAITLLHTLLEANGQPVTKSTLLEAAWPGQIVEEGNLTVQIAALRKAIGEDMVVTVPRVGYRLLRTDAPKPSGPHLPVLAVLPFANLSGEPEQDYFADGVVEDIITALSRFKSFAVVSRNSTFAYKGRAIDTRGIARELGVRYLLEGSVRRAGNSLRISAKLVDGADGLQLWGQNFDGERSDIFDFQDRITQSVVGLVEPNIRRTEIERTRRDRPESMDAYDLYLRALPDVYRSTADSVARAISHLEQAITLDPGFASAIAMAAQSYMLRIVFQFEGVSDTDIQRGTTLARAALDLTRDDAVVVAYSGFCLLHVAREHETGLSLLRLAVSENPNSAEILGMAGIGSLMAGDLVEAADILHRCLSLDPNSVSVHWQLTGMAHIRMAEGRWEEALEWATRSLAVNNVYEPTYWMLAAGNAHLGRMEQARKHLEGLTAVHPGITLTRINQGQHFRDPHRINVLIEGMRIAGLPES